MFRGPKFYIQWLDGALPVDAKRGRVRPEQGREIGSWGILTVDYRTDEWPKRHSDDQ